MANRKNTFILKRSNVAGKAPSSGDLLLGEVAINTADVILYASGTTANTILPIGWDRVARTGDTMTGPLYGPSISATTISATTFYGNGNITVTGTASISTVSATTYYNLPIDVTVTGGTPNNSNRTYVFTNNTGGTFTVNCLTDITITGGTYDSINGIVSFVNNSGGTFSVTGFTTGSTFSGTTNYYSRFTSGGTISNGMIYDNGSTHFYVAPQNDNAALAVVSASGYYYPSLQFFNNSNNYLGGITAYNNTLYIAGAGASPTPLQVSSVVSLPYLSANTLTYLDSSSTIRNVTLGSGLSLSTGGTLSISAGVTNITSSATPSIDYDVDQYNITALATDITSVSLSGTFVDRQRLIVTIKDNGTARTITWGSSFNGTWATLPTTTVVGKTWIGGFIYNATTSKYECVASFFSL